MKLGVTAVMLPELDFEQQIALCVKTGLSFYQYRPRQISLEQRGKAFSYWGNHQFDLTPQRLVNEGAAMTKRLRAAGLEPFGTVPAISVDSPDEMIALHVRGAAVSEAGRIRCNPPGYPKIAFDYPKYLAATVRRYAEVVEKIARPAGIKLVIETHSITAAASPALAWNILREFSPKDVGAIFDIANFNREGELVPRLAVAVLRDYIDCVHIGGLRRVSPGRDEWGCRKIEHVCCALEEADGYIPNWIAALKEAKVEAPLIIEDYEEGISSEVRLTRAADLLRRLLE